MPVLFSMWMISVCVSPCLCVSLCMNGSEITECLCSVTSSWQLAGGGGEWREVGGAENVGQHGGERGWGPCCSPSFPRLPCFLPLCLVPFHFTTTLSSSLAPHSMGTHVVESFPALQHQCISVSQWTSAQRWEPDKEIMRVFFTNEPCACVCVCLTNVLPCTTCHSVSLCVHNQIHREARSSLPSSFAVGGMDFWEQGLPW